MHNYQSFGILVILRMKIQNQRIVKTEEAFFIDGKMGSTETLCPPHELQNLVKGRRHYSSHLLTLVEEMRWLK